MSQAQQPRDKHIPGTHLCPTFFPPFIANDVVIPTVRCHRQQQPPAPSAMHKEAPAADRNSTAATMPHKPN
eukprot:365338-Chlamydomonas_euryale.AAC.18